ncbi:helix-turn-helix transcriptional regulator [Thalassotalea psychrophila]|uniref:Helix-turn-helix transcriptional regulator n=1 Tax=Thalassotalea psychrophila TaxID=3065647 RepID=A0ABY9TYU2_9GAMM|nr:helix-turn-helix transcriptional regulator [Colwelliaceae bacterium SQ149]
MKIIPLIPTHFYLPYFLALKDFDIKHLHFQDYIDMVMENDSELADFKISAVVFRHLFEIIERNRIKDFGIYSAQKYSLKAFSNQLNRLEQDKNVLLSNLFKFCCEFNKQGYLPSASLEKANSGDLYFCHKRMTKFSIGENIVQQHSIISFISVIQFLIDDELWQPKEVHLQGLQDDNDLQHALPNTQIYRGRECNRVVIERNMFAESFSNKYFIQRRQYSYSPPVNFCDQLIQLLTPFIGHKIPKLSYVAKVSGISARTIQRMLQLEDKSYRNLIMLMIMDKAKLQLCNSNKQIQEISALLGYTDKAHFTRAFKSYFGITPKSYRQLQTKKASK